jgi:hypothetical protein
MSYRYLPLIRTKAGEATALHHLITAAKQRTLPIFHMTTEVPTTFLPKVIAAWSGRPAAVDGTWNFGQSGTTTAFSALINGLRAGGVPAFPCVEVNAPQPYLAAVNTAVGAPPGLGVVLKARLGQIAELQAWITSTQWAPQSVDLIISAGHVPDFGHGVLDPVVAQHLASIPPLGWRSVTLAASAAPKDFSSLALGANAVPRLDWMLWQAVHQGAPGQLDYGDFGTSHPDLTDVPGIAMGSATVSVKYTLDGSWLMIKGRPVTGQYAIPMPVQYRGHSQALASAAGFGGLAGCWGDARIQQIATNAANSGGRATWVEIAMNRHLSLVADRLP